MRHASGTTAIAFMQQLDNMHAAKHCAGPLIDSSLLQQS
jgi:hypothetical protein